MAGVTLDDLFDDLTPHARALAAQVGCSLNSEKPVLLECVEPLSVRLAVEEAIKELSVRLAVTHASYYGGVSRIVESDGINGLLGFSANRVPMLCVVRA